MMGGYFERCSIDHVRDFHSHRLLFAGGIRRFWQPEFCPSVWWFCRHHWRDYCRRPQNVPRIDSALVAHVPLNCGNQLFRSLNFTLYHLSEILAYISGYTRQANLQLDAKKQHRS